ncbi:hypothetical protein EGW08_018044, partial [Elysia chlorotica]
RPYLRYETVHVKLVTTGKQVETSRHQRVTTTGAFVLRLDQRIPVARKNALLSLNLLPDFLGALRGFLHLLLQAVNVLVILLEGRDDSVL